MRIELPLPSPWSKQHRDAVDVWARPDSGITIEVDPIAPLPPDREAWGKRVLYRHLPAGGSVIQTDIVDSKSKRAWPVTVVTTILKDAVGTALEAQVSVFYELVHFGTSIVCRVPVGAIAKWETELRVPVLEAVLSAVPVFGGGPEIARIGELFEMTPAE